MENDNNHISDFLFASPNFLTGAGTVINIAGNYYKYSTSKSGCEADNLAIRNDFNMVGQDIYDVILNKNK